MDAIFQPTVKEKMRMDRWLFPKVLLLLVIVILISACATSPIDKAYRLNARRDDLPFPMALRNPDQYAGSAVVWGGIIIQTKNLKKGSQIIIMETSLDDTTRPIDPRDTRGRFIAASPDFLDPELYRKGRAVTVAGVIAGKKILPVGDSNYTYPVVTIQQIYLWEEKKEPPEYYYVYPRFYWGWGPHWYWGGGHHRHHH